MVCCHIYHILFTQSAEKETGTEAEMSASWLSARDNKAESKAESTRKSQRESKRDTTREI